MEETAETAEYGVSTGTFDGVHRGHQLLLTSLREASEAKGLSPLILTFDRHPLEVIAPERAPKLIMASEERDDIIRGLGVNVEEISFTEELRRLSAREWLDRLRREYGAGIVVLGYDNRFGSDGRSLSWDDYRRTAADLGLDFLQAPEIPGISSSAIRRAIAEGNIQGANEMLGRDWTLSGTVEQGRKVGRRIGFRTANLSVDPSLLLPATGVYATEAMLPDGSSWRALTNVGVRPTFSDPDTVSVETHIPGIDADLYGKPLRLTFLRRIRPERRFDSPEALKAQIAEDLSEIM